MMSLPTDVTHDLKEKDMDCHMQSVILSHSNNMESYSSSQLHRAIIWVGCVRACSVATRFAQGALPVAEGDVSTRVWHSNAKMEAMLVCGSMENGGMFCVRRGPWIFQKRGCF